MTKYNDLEIIGQRTEGGAAMTTMANSQVTTKATSNKGRTGIMSKPNWLGTLALIGTLLLCLGVSMSSAGQVEDKLLPKIMKQLDDQGKEIKSTSVIQIGSEPEVTVILTDGEVRKYNGQGQMKMSIDANKKITLYEEGMPVTETDSAGNIISETKYFKGDNGKVKKSVKVGPSGTTTKIFDKKGNIQQVSDSQGTKNYSNYVKNEKGKTLSYRETNMSTNKTTTNLLDPKSGEVVAKIDDNGIRTDIEVQKDKNGEKKAIIERDSNGKLTVKKFKDGQMTEKVEDGVVTKYKNTMDAQGILVQTKEVKRIPTANGYFQEEITKNFDKAGRVTEQTDSKGKHKYTYTLSADGAIVGRREELTSPGDDKPRIIDLEYDEGGRIISQRENGQDTKTVYVLDEMGNIMSAVETVSIQFGNQTVIDTITKIYDGQGNVKTKTDGTGQKTEFTYDANGNQTVVEKENEITHNVYDNNNNMTSSVTRDHKSTTYTNYDPETKLATSKVRVTNSGVIETTSFGLDENGQRVSHTLTAFGVKTSIMIDPNSDHVKHSTFTKNNGKVVTTSYEYAGEHMLSSREEGPTGTTDTFYNIYGKPVMANRIDQFGRSYDTEYKYIRGKTSETIMSDGKGQTITKFNKYEDPSVITRLNTIGYPRKSIETRTYKDGMLSESESQDVKGKSITYYDENESAARVHRINKHGFPRENWVTNVYDEGGDVVRTQQTDNRGITNTEMDKDGLQTKSVRRDFHGFPREKTTTYQYVKGEMVTSITEDERGTSYSDYDRDGLQSRTVRKKKFGYPREEVTTYEYDQDAYMTKSHQEDENGYTDSEYTIDEVVGVSHRENKYGHARDQWTTFEYDGLGYMTWSKQTDLRGITLTQYDIDSLAVNNMRYDRYGVTYSRDTITFNSYDEKGFMTNALSKNLMGDTLKTMDKDNLTRKVVQKDNYGVLWARNKVSDQYEYDDHGRMQTSVSTDKTGTTSSVYDIHGDAIENKRLSNTGLGASRQSFTESAFEADTGMTIRRVNRTEYGVTESLDFDARTGLEKKNISKNNYGLLASRQTTTQVDMDIRHGLNRRSVAVNEYGRTETSYDTVDEGKYGIATGSVSYNEYGLLATRKTTTFVEADPNTGLNLRTKAVNKYGTTITEYDALHGGLYGVAEKSFAKNNFGLGATKETETDIDANTFTGLNKKTVAVNAYSKTTTEYDDQTYGISLRSEAENNFGLGKTRHNQTEVTANVFNGLNQKTVSTTEYGKTETIYDDQEYGVSLNSVADNNFGLEASLHTTTQIDANVFNGLNRKTIAKNQYSVTVTKYDDQESGVSEESRAQNKFGLGATRSTVTKIQANRFNGLNEETVAENAYSKTITLYDSADSGVSETSKSINNYGLMASRETVTQITANKDNGLNEMTVAKNAYGTTQTFYDSVKTGVSVRSLSNNNFGLLASRQTETKITANKFNGLNIETVATNNYGTTKTEYDKDDTGVALASHASNNFGLEASSETDTQITANTFNGLNEKTVGTNQYGKTTTIYDSAHYGVSLKSMAENNYGLGASLVTGTVIDANIFNGLNKQTVAKNNYGETITDYDDKQYGVSEKSEARNKYGLYASRTTYTKINANVENGLNKETYAVNEYGKTKTFFDSEKTGVSKRSIAVNNFGLGAAETTETVIDADTFNGLNKSTVATNAYGTTVTKYDNKKTGVSLESDAVNNYGLGAAAKTHTTVHANTYNGLNQMTVAENEYGKTTTFYDDQDTGVSTHSLAQNNFGLDASRETVTLISANAYNGLNDSTMAKNAYGVTLTKYDSEKTGVSLSSMAKNNFGLGFTRQTITKIQANTFNGLNENTLAVNKYGTTKTYYDSEKTGVAEKSVAVNNFGLGATIKTVTEIDANTFNGLNTETVAKNDYGVTKTFYDDEDTGAAEKSIAKNNYGLKATQTTETVIKANRFNGLNIETVATNEYGQTTTKYDSEKTGVAVQSLAENNFGLDATKVTLTNIDANKDNGLNIKTEAINKYGRTLTNYDDTKTGVALNSLAMNNFGLESTRKTYTDITANTFNGLNEQTVADNQYGKTITEYDSNSSGVAKKSIAVNYYGLGASRKTVTQIEASDYNGLNIKTVATNKYGRTETYYDSASSGVAMKSIAVNNFGLRANKKTVTTIKANKFNGMNTQTTAVNDYGTTVTKYDDQEYGVAVQSTSDNNFGLEASAHTNTDIQANTFNGLNEKTTAKNIYGKTTTIYDSAEYGISLKSVSENNYGLGASLITGTKIDANTFNGLNKETVAKNNYGETITKYDDALYGVALESTAKNIYGLLSSRQTYTNITANTYNGLNENTKATNEYGTTWTKYDSDKSGVAEESVAVNNYGLGASLKTTTKIQASKFNGLNEVTTATNAYGTTVTKYDSSKTGVSVESNAHNHYGLGASADTKTVITANTYNGLNEKTVATNAYGSTTTYYDSQNTGVSIGSVADNNFGLDASRHTVTAIAANVYNGLNIATMAENDYGKTYTVYDSQKTGVSLASLAKNNFGLGYSRTTVTKIQANTFNGLNEKTVAKNLYGTTTTIYDSQKTGVSTKSIAVNNFGLLASRKTTTTITANTWNGLNTKTVAVNKYGTTTTFYDDQDTGTSVKSVANNNYGLKASRKTITTIKASRYNGLNEMTVATNAYGTTTTHYDSQDTGVSVSSDAVNNFGLEASRISHTDIKANKLNGLNIQTKATNAYGETITNFDDQSTGVSLESFANNNFGLGFSKKTYTKITANTFNGLNEKTVATNKYGKTTSFYDSAEYGVSLASVSQNNYGLDASKNTVTKVQANTFNGLNQKTIAKNAYGTTVTYFDDANYGVSLKSKSSNNYGLTASKVTETSIVANTFNGLNKMTIAKNDYGTTVTLYDDKQSGVSEESFAMNNFGLGANRFTHTNIQANLDNGLNQVTVASNAYGTTTTHYDDQNHGVSLYSDAVNNYGLGASMKSHTETQANTFNGLNEMTIATTAYGTTTTYYDSTSTGVSLGSIAVNKYGLGASRKSLTIIKASTYNGLNKETTAISAYGTTVTKYDSDNYGVSLSSVSVNKYGLGASLKTNTAVTANKFNGLNELTVAVNAYGKTVTQYDSQKSGVSLSSQAYNNYGLNFSKNSNTNIIANTYNGLNKYTEAVTMYGKTQTWYDDQEYGVSETSKSTNNFGLLASRVSTTSITANLYNGLNKTTVATSAYGTTLSFFDDQKTGTTTGSISANNYGLGKTRTTITSVTANKFNGQNISTLATNAYSKTLTFYDHEDSGVSTGSISVNNYGIGASKVNTTVVTASKDHGMNVMTVGTSAYGTTTTYYDGTYGVSVMSVSKNNYGLYASRNSTTHITSNVYNGLNKSTVAVSAYGKTTTFYDDKQYGVSKSSVAENNYGLMDSRKSVSYMTNNTDNGLSKSNWSYSKSGVTHSTFDDQVTGCSKWSESWTTTGLRASRYTTTDVTVNTFTGMNKKTVGTNAYGTTTSYFNDTTTGTSKSSKAENNFGIKASRITNTTVTANVFNGLNKKTVAINKYGKTITNYDDKNYGVSKNSTATNNYGIGAAQTTYSTVTANINNGMNELTVAENAYGTTTTEYDDEYGISVRTIAQNNYGVGSARFTTTVVTANTYSGLNLKTVATNGNGTTTTFYEGTYGLATSSVAKTNFGLLYSRNTTTTIYANNYTGQNWKTVATNTYGTTTSYFNSWGNGAINKSVAKNNYGAPAGRTTTTTFDVNTFTGQNKTSTATSAINTVKTWYDHTGYGLATKSKTTGVYGAAFAKVTDTVVTNDKWTGLNIMTVGTNKMSTTTSYFEQQYGTTTHTSVENKYGTGGSKHSETIVDASKHTGLNKKTYAKTALSETWTNFHSTKGNQTDSWTHMLDEGSTLPDARWTYNEYTSYNTGVMKWSKATNLMGITYTNYNTNGFNTNSTNYSAFGIASRTYTTFTVNTNTGINKKSVAKAYSRKNGSRLSTTTSHMNSNGLVYKTVSSNTYGAYNGRTTTTNIDKMNAWNGNKEHSTSSNGLGTSESWFKANGTEDRSTNSSYYGAKYGRNSTTWVKSSDPNNGIKRATWTTSGLSKSTSYYDVNGLPGDSSRSGSIAPGAGTIYQEKEALYGPADGSKRDSTYVGNIHWTGNPSETFSVSAISTTRSYMTADGKMTSGVTTNVYAANGDQQTNSTYSVDSNTGQTKYSRVDKYGKEDYTQNWFNTTYGYVSTSKSHTKKDDEWNTTTTTNTVNLNTGQTSSSYATGDNGYKKWTNYTSQGRSSSATTHQDKQDGKDKVTEKYSSYYTVNAWTGLLQKEERYNISHSKRETITYDDHGVKTSSLTHENGSSYPSGQIDHLTEFQGDDGQGNATSATVYIGDSRTEHRSNFKWVYSGGEWVYLYQKADIIMHKNLYVTTATINYTLGTDGPVSAVYSDNKGTEQWTMNGSYSQAGVDKRVRVNNDGSTKTWTYTSNPTGPFHTAATISYTDMNGHLTGSGTETYTTAGILKKQVLNNSNGLSETINYQNDGNAITVGSGVRENGQLTSYFYVGENNLSMMRDDKGQTTVDTSTGKLISTSGSLGDFTYTYSGGKITKISGTSALDGSTEYDANWNMKKWTDSMGVVHTYTALNTSSKGFVTKAKETFTDKNGTSWEGTMNYDTYGFYFNGGTLKATNVKLDGTAAVNTTQLDANAALAFIKNLLTSKQTEKETFSWNPPGSSQAKKTLGQLKKENLTAADITKFCDVEITINADGTTSSKYTNMRFNEMDFMKQNRYKPKSSTSYYTVVSDSAPGTGDYRNTGRINDVFYNGSCGYQTSQYSSRQVQVGTNTTTYYLEIIPDDPETTANEYQEIEHSSQAYDDDGNPLYTPKTRSTPIMSIEWTIKKVSWSKQSDGWQWTSKGTRTENKYADAMTKNTGTIVASPVKSRTQAQGSVTQFVAAASAGRSNGVGVALGGFVNTLKVASNAASGIVSAASNAVQSATASPKVSAVKAAAVTETTETTEVAKENQDELMKAFASIDSVADIADFITKLGDVIGPKGVAGALSDSSNTGMMKALIATFKAVFGDTYQTSLLGKIVALSVGDSSAFNDVKMAIVGGQEVLPGEMKLAAKIAKDLENAKDVKKNSDGEVVAAVDKDGNSRKFEYDKSGLTETVNYADGKSEVNRYDNTGKMLSKSVGGVNTTYAYDLDNAGKVTKITVNERSAEGINNAEYDSEGRLTKATEGQGEIVYSYDGAGEKNFTAKVINQAGNVAEERTYKDGRMAERKKSDGSTTRYDYLTDGSGKVVAITMTTTDRDGEKTQAKYDGNGRLITKKTQGDDRSEKVAKDGEMAEQTMAFEIQKDLFGDPRMDGMRIDNKVLMQGMGQQQ